ncbi:hypothetical protein D6C83_09431 [Aureobasidium pullulans]|uniref:Uncharacterized protein n=1 Tax=Aureobasidium pullulans TaxID=5580 RepID=A0A4S9Y4U5_AURPU|nr:hypothetical protein D6C83_09431 [Aureobasidium pullulans]
MKRRIATRSLARSSGTSSRSTISPIRMSRVELSFWKFWTRISCPSESAIDARKLRQLAGSSRRWLILAKKPKPPARTLEMTKRMPKPLRSGS